MNKIFDWSNNYKDVDQTKFALLKRVKKRLIQRSKLFDTIDRLLPNPTPSKSYKILEVACGMGIEANILSILGYRVWGIDNEKESLIYANRIKSFLNSEIILLEDNAFNLQFKDNEFDLIYSQGFLEHFSDEDVSKILKEQLRALKPNGILLIDVPNKYSSYSIYKRLISFFHKEWFFGFERSFSPMQIKRRMFEANPKVQFIESYGWSFWGYPIKSIADYLFMAPLLLGRSLLLLINKGQDNVCLFFKK